MAASDENIPKNPNYVVTIRRVQPDPEIVIQAGLPESFAFGVNANYEPRLPNSITDVAGQNLVQRASSCRSTACCRNFPTKSGSRRRPSSFRFHFCSTQRRMRALTC